MTLAPSDHRVDASPPPPPVRSVWRLRRMLPLRRMVILTAMSMLAGCATFIGFNVALQVVQHWNGSGAIYVQLDGERVYLVQPTAVVAPPQSVPTPTTEPMRRLPAAVGGTNATTAQPLESSQATTPAPTVHMPIGSPHQHLSDGGQPGVVTEPAAVPASSPRMDVPLPPVALEIPAIGLHVPVLIATSDTMPRQRYAGWFFKSAFPATAGNMVLLGHLDGKAAIFARLDELNPGDEVRVLTRDQVHVYVVEWTETVDESRVDVLAPVDDAVLTLVTCAGDWDRGARMYKKRLIVRASYTAVEERVSSSR